MKIGIFDSGLGGLLLLKDIVQTMPQYDYVYLGDTARVPYGDKNPEAIYLFTEQAVGWLKTQQCNPIVVACNTSSAQALRKIQQCFIPVLGNPNQKVLGMVIPTVETILSSSSERIGVLATQATVNSQVYSKEIAKLYPNSQVWQVAAPELVPLIEQGHLDQASEQAMVYIEYLLEKNIQTLILGCTHYGILKQKLAEQLPQDTKIISQGEFIPQKLEEYLQKHVDVEQALSKNGTVQLFATKITPELSSKAVSWFGPNAKLELVSISGS